MDLKPPTTFDDQLQKLKMRGCFIADEAFCKRILARVNYYRLTAYFIPFRRGDGLYREGTSFHRVYRIYEFDRKMRELLFSIIEEIELYLRTQLAYYHAHKYGADGYMAGSNYNSKHDHVLFKALVEKEISHNRTAPFVDHHLKNYGGKFPIWALVELFSFGMLSHFYADLVLSDQKQIARSLYQTTPYNLRSWLRCCTDLRNICAHYGRLYYQIFPAIPATLQGFELQLGRRLFDNVVVLKWLYPDKMTWNHRVFPALNALIEEYYIDVDLNLIGFPTTWDILLINK